MFGNLSEDIKTNWNSCVCFSYRLVKKSLMPTFIQVCVIGMIYLKKPITAKHYWVRKMVQGISDIYTKCLLVFPCYRGFFFPGSIYAN